jgi:outer membrane autotransporter protein
VASGSLGLVQPQARSQAACTVTGSSITVAAGATCFIALPASVRSLVMGNGSTVQLDANTSQTLTIDNAGGLSTLTVHTNSNLTPINGSDANLLIGSAPTDFSTVNNDGRINLGTGTITINSPGSFTNSGDITAREIVTSNGADTFTITSGTVNAALNQGDGIDEFIMTGGVLNSLKQGDGRDIFTMSGGHIIGAFEDGDVATLSGGRIGRVDMKLDNNIFTMTGGTIDGNLVAGFGNDTFAISGGLIGGNISVSGGTDSVTITGGQVNGEVRMSTGNDTFLWENDGIVLGLIDMGIDDDLATLRNLASQIENTAGFQGGLGNDSLTLDNTQATNISRFTQWETIALTNGSRFNLDSNLTLGDSGTLTGSLTIDSSSSLQAVSGVDSTSISPASSSAQANVINAGTINLATGGASHRLTINGNYTGNNGLVSLQSELGDDNSPSDRLIVNGGTIGGSSLLAVTNAGGAGGQTLTDGILLVQATGGTTSAADAFRLQQRVRAGAYEYYLYKGGVSDGTSESWFLRSTLPTPVPEPTPAPSPTPGPNPTPSPTPTPTPQPPQLIAPPAGTPELPENGLSESGEAVPIYRYETPTYALLPALARDINVFSLATFHDRRGDQGDLGVSTRQQIWSRMAVSGWNQNWNGSSQPQFNGTLTAVNLGIDLGIQPTGHGGSRRWGGMFSFGNADGGVQGFTYATANNRSGSVNIQSYGFSLYGTLVDPSGWYVDVVGGVNLYDLSTQSRSGVNADTDGWGWTLSVETGYPIKLGGNWQLEPELQLIGTGSSIDSFNDGIASMSFSSPWAVLLRSGVRIAYEGRSLQPFLRANFWTTFAGDDGVTFDGNNTLATGYGNTTIQLGGGVVWKLNSRFGIEASVDYLTQSQNTSLDGIAGNLQLRLRL